MELELLPSSNAAGAAVDATRGRIVLDIPLPAFNCGIYNHLPFSKLDSLAAFRVRTAVRNLALSLKPDPLADSAAPNLSGTRFNHMADLTMKGWQSLP